jgi:drug/metabolite transporter (DMT)-like permease
MADRERRSGRSGPKVVGTGLAVLSAGAFATSGIFAAALIGAGWSPAAAALARFGGPSLLLAAPAALQLRGRWALLRGEANRILIYGLVAVGGGQLSYFNAIKAMPIGIALVFEYVGLVLVVGWLWVRHGQRPRRLTAAGVVTVIAGLVLMVGAPGPSRISLAGIVWGLLEAVSLAAYFLLSAADGDETLPPLAMTWSGMCVGATLFAVVGVAGAMPVTARADDVDLLHHQMSWLIPVLELVFVATVIAYCTGIAAARRLGAKLASLIGIVEVLFAALYAWLLLGQVLSSSQFAGGALILAGVIVVRVDENAVNPAETG